MAKPGHAAWNDHAAEMPPLTLSVCPVIEADCGPAKNAAALAMSRQVTSNSMRFVPIQSLGSRVPTPDRRARFLSAQSSVQQVWVALRKQQVLLLVRPA
mgnify:CR=1 FL=1